jgi:cold shock CspA family protein
LDERFCVVFFFLINQFLREAFKLQGKVKWFMQKRVLGLLKVNEGGDVFVHFSASRRKVLKPWKKDNKWNLMWLRETVDTQAPMLPLSSLFIDL